MQRAETSDFFKWWVGAAAASWPGRARSFLTRRPASPGEPRRAARRSGPHAQHYRCSVRATARDEAEVPPATARGATASQAIRRRADKVTHRSTAATARAERRRCPTVWVWTVHRTCLRRSTSARSTWTSATRPSPLSVSGCWRPTSGQRTRRCAQRNVPTMLSSNAVRARVHDRSPGSVSPWLTTSGTRGRQRTC
jgi:hypothetical protein